MGELIYRAGGYLLGNAINRMLTAAGLTLATASISISVVDALIQNTKKHLEGISDFGIAIIDLSGTDVALSLVISAILTRLTVERGMVFIRAVS